MTPFGGIMKLIQLMLPQSLHLSLWGNQEAITGTRRRCKDSPHRTKRNCTQKLSRGQSSISLVLQRPFCSLSRSLDCFPLPFLEGISKEDLSSSIFAGQNLSPSLIFSAPEHSRHVTEVLTHTDDWF